MNFDLVVSIVIYKPALQILQQTLDSFSETKLKIQVVLFDNSKQPLDTKQLKSCHPINYNFNKKNIGYGRAHNQNMKKWAPQSKYFLVLNPDVFFDAELLQTLLQRMEEATDIGLCIPKICHPNGRLQLINRRLPRPQDYLISFLSNKLSTNFFKTKTYNKYLLKDVNTNLPYICPMISGCFMLFRSPVLLEVGGFDEKFFLYLEDTDLSRRVSEKYKTVVFSDLVAYHHWTRGAYRNTKLFFIFIGSILTYFNKWGWIHDPLRAQLNEKVQLYSAPHSAQKLYTSENSVLNPARV